MHQFLQNVRRWLASGSLSRARGADLLLEHIAIATRLVLRLDNVGIVVERLENVADVSFQIPVLRDVVAGPGCSAPPPALISASFHVL
jgi:hypothetical protein